MRTGDIPYEHTMRFRALVIDLLVQILIKLHIGVRGAQRGADEVPVMALAKEASDFGLQCRGYAAREAAKEES
jgi:hypothetical protein